MIIITLRCYPYHKKKRRKHIQEHRTQETNDKRRAITEIKEKAKVFHVLSNQSLQQIKDREIFTPKFFLYPSPITLNSLKGKLKRTYKVSSAVNKLL